MEHRQERGRSYSAHVRGLAPARGVRSLLGGPQPTTTRRRQNAAASGQGGVSNADLEGALSRLGTYVLLNGSRDLVQRVLRAIAAARALSRM
jgi:hypothetical protein